MAPTYTTTSLGIRWLPGSNLASDIDAGFSALATDVDALIVARDALLGVSSGGNVRSGKSIIATAETRANTAYGLLTTPDRVQSVVLPTDGVIMILYRALWKLSAGGADARAAIFIGSNQLKIAEVDGAPKTQAGVAFGSDLYHTLTSASFGLISADAATTDESVVTTGQVIGSMIGAASIEIGGSLRLGGSGAYGYAGGSGVNVPAGGICWVEAAAGTYDISVQYKAASGTVSVKNRQLRVRAMSF